MRTADTGSHRDTVLENARDLDIDLSDVQDAILTHNHWDHVSRLTTLRKEMMKKNPLVWSRVYIARGIFYSRLSQLGEQSQMVALKKEYEATGRKFIELEDETEIFPGARMTGLVPRKYPEHNWSVSGTVQAPAGLVEDTTPEDQSLVFNTTEGLVVITGCGHAGTINILTRESFPKQPVHAIIGGLHLFPATDQPRDWTRTNGRSSKWKIWWAHIARASKRCIASTAASIRRWGHGRTKLCSGGRDTSWPTAENKSTDVG